MARHGHAASKGSRTDLNLKYYSRAIHHNRAMTWPGNVHGLSKSGAAILCGQFLTCSNKGNWAISGITKCNSALWQAQHNEITLRSFPGLTICSKDKVLLSCVSRKETLEVRPALLVLSSLKSRARRVPDVDPEGLEIPALTYNITQPLASHLITLSSVLNYKTKRLD